MDDFKKMVKKLYKKAKSLQYLFVWLVKRMIKPNILDIDSRYPYPSGALSNFSEYEFEIDEINCSSMEGFLQSLKFEDLDEQKYICSLVGKNAKKAGQNKEWKQEQILWWRGTSINRHHNEYQELLDRVYDALLNNNEFVKVLVSTKRKVLTHSIGSKNPNETVLTENEFCERLMNLRSKVIK